MRTNVCAVGRGFDIIRTLTIRCDRLIDGVSEVPRHDAVVRVEGDTIAAVSWRGGPPPPAADGEVLDGAGLSLLPGLIDSHTHLCFSGGPDPLADLEHDDDYQLLLLAVGNAQRALARGITTVADCGGRGLLTLHLRRGFETGQLTGPRVLSSGMPITIARGHCHWLGLEADSVDDVILAARRMAEAGCDFLKVMVTGGNMTPGSDASAVQYGLEHLQAVVREGRRNGRRVVAHAHSDEGIRLAALAGVDVIAHATGLTDGGIELSEETVEALVRSRAVVDPTLAVGIAAADSGLELAPGARVRFAHRQQQISFLQNLHRRGVRLLAGTDAGTALLRHDELLLSMERLVLEVGLTPSQAIRAATRDAAEALGLGSVLGTVEVGKVADVVLVEGDPVADLSCLSLPTFVIHSGKVVAQEGRLVQGEPWVAGTELLGVSADS